MKLGKIHVPGGSLRIGDPCFLQFGATVDGLPEDLNVRAARVRVGGWGERIAEVTLSSGATRGLAWEDSGQTFSVDTATAVAFPSALTIRFGETNRARNFTTYYSGDISKPESHWWCSCHSQPPPAYAGHPFPHFEHALEEFGGRTMNQLVASGELRRNEMAINADEFSEGGAFATSSLSGVGLLRYGGEPVAVATISGLGDGRYPVHIARRRGRVVAVKLLFLGGDDL